jgi:hypothetical protein
LIEFKQLIAFKSIVSTRTIAPIASTSGRIKCMSTSKSIESNKLIAPKAWEQTRSKSIVPSSENDCIQLNKHAVSRICVYQSVDWSFHSMDFEDICGAIELAMHTIQWYRLQWGHQRGEHLRARRSRCRTDRNIPARYPTWHRVAYKSIVWAFQADDRITVCNTVSLVLSTRQPIYLGRTRKLSVSTWTSNVHYYLYGEWRVLETRTAGEPVVWSSIIQHCAVPRPLKIQEQHQYQKNTDILHYMSSPSCLLKAFNISSGKRHPMSLASNKQIVMVIYDGRLHWCIYKLHIQVVCISCGPICAGVVYSKHAKSV